ncbi:MAG: hypothetical protein IKY14_05725 [Erysipelotrichaceae bacterium]|nr:hypothetical protein [Erysipelotrichaceae bacterium]
MIISVQEAKELVDLSSWTDKKIQMKLNAIEQAIRSHTHNNFQKRAYRSTADIIGGAIVLESITPFKIGDTVQISSSRLNDGLFTVRSVYNLDMTVEEDVEDESNVLITKVEYPDDVIDCVVNCLEWEKNFRGKVGIQSETLSRHSVTYEAQGKENTVKGYPVSLFSCLKSYMKARF